MKNGWKEITIGKLVGERAGNLDPSSYPDETFNYYSIPAYQEAGEPVEEVGKNIRSQKQIVEFGTVLFGKLNPRVEKVWIVDSRSSLRKIASTEWISVPVRLELANPRFIYYLFWSDQVMLLAKALVAGSTPSRQRVDPKSFFEIPVSLPPLPEQKKIAAVLLKIQRAIETQGKIIQSLRELKKSTMQHLFTHGLHGEKTKMTEIGEIPESWEVRPLGEMGRIGNGSTPKRTHLGYWDNGSVPWLTSGKIHEVVIEEPDQFVTAKAVEECHLPTVQKGGLLIAITGQGKTLGNAAIVTFDSTMSQHLAYVQPENPSIHPPYVQQYLTTCYQDLRRIGFGGGSTKGALTCADLRQYRIPLPQTIEEQIEIAQCLETFDTKAILHESKKSALQDVFKTTLNRLMTGEIRVGNLDIDVGEVET